MKHVCIKYPDTEKEILDFENFLHDHGFTHIVSNASFRRRKFDKLLHGGWIITMSDKFIHTRPRFVSMPYMRLLSGADNALSLKEFLDTYRFHIYLYRYKL